MLCIWNSLVKAAPVVIRATGRCGLSDSVARKSVNEVVYLTDIEGDYDYWERLLARSVVQRDEHGLKLPHDTGFVFGGDVCDRGAGDLRILRDLLQLRERHPGRVYFILGNRDINKLRLIFNLHPMVVYHDVPCYWMSHLVRRNGLTASGRLKWVSSLMSSSCPFLNRLSISL
jgi:hypothetical protein